MQIIRLALLSSFLLIIIKCVPSAWDNIQTGKITPISTFSGNFSASTYSLTVFVTGNTTAATPQGCIAVISYDAITSVSFAFNSSIQIMNATQMIISIQTTQTTYFWVLSYQYLIHARTSMQITNLCYYTGNLLVGTGVRNQFFSNATTTFTGRYLTVTTVLSGFIVNNTKGQYFSLTVNSVINNLTITTEVATAQYNIVEWACLSVILFDAKAPTTIPGEFYFKDSSVISYALQLSNLATYDSAFLIPNTMFFGISSLKINLNLVNRQVLILNTDNVADPKVSPSINLNQQAISLQQLFIWYDTCSNATMFVPQVGFTCVTACLTTQYSSPNYYCLSCSFQTGNCKTCSSTQCTSCQAASPVFRTLKTTVNPDICACSTGYFQLGSVCVACSLYVPNCNACANQSVCTGCQSGFFLSAGLCYCANGTYMVNGTCSILMGCLTSSSLTSGAYCITCDTANYFYMTVSLTCLCSSNTIYDTYTGKCVGNCSDGASMANECDLGPLNGVAGSGCASNCTVVAGYYCSNPNLQNKSICVNISSFTAQYLYAVKELSSNTADLYVQITPNNAYLTKMNFANLIQTTIPTTTITATFDSSTGILLIKATYSESIEGTMQTLNISFDSTVIYSPTITLYVKTTGVNSQLMFNVFESYNNIIQYAAMFVGGLALAFALLSGVMGYKLFGWEICMPVQIVYLNFALLAKPTSAISSLIGLGYSTGYNQMKSYTLLKNLGNEQSLINMQITYEFLANCNYSFAPLIILIILAMITRIGVKQQIIEPKKSTGKSLKKKTDQKQLLDLEKTLPPVQVSCMENAHHFIVDKLLINYCILMLLYGIFCFGVQSQVQTNYSGMYSTNLNIAVSLVFLAIVLGGFMFTLLKNREKNIHVTFRSESRYYPIVYITCQAIGVIVILLTYYATSFSIFFILLPQAMILYYYIKLSPHGTLRNFSSITGLYCQVMTPACTAVFIVSQYLQSSMMPTICAFSIVGLTIIGEGLSIARLIIKYRQQKQKQKQNISKDKVKEENDHLEAMAYSSIKNNLISQTNEKMLKWQGPDDNGENVGPQNQNSYEKIKQKGQDSEDQKEEDSEDQLKKIKMRLRKQIFEKRNFDL